MLIDSPRLKRGDKGAWDQLERYDRKLAHAPRLTTLETKATQVLHDFAAAGDCYVSTSWGKDSTVLAHLLATSGLDLPLVWVRVQDWENPDCLTVRDQFLDQYPHVDYHEIEVEATAPRWWETGAEDKPPSQRTSKGGFTIAEKRWGGRHISGVRAEESKVRGIAQRRWGDAGPYAARPIGWWTAVDVFAYLAKYGLPIHPAYAMSFAGRMDRRWLRVSSIGGIRGADRQRADWEAAYYPDIVNQPTAP